MTQELLEVFSLDGICQGTRERNQFYEDIKKEYAETGVISLKIEIIRVLFQTTVGRLFLQKRSMLKSENFGMWDKTVGGMF